MIAFISCGSIQLLVGPQSFSSTLQMKVRSSTRATSVGSEAAWKEFGFLSAFSRVKVPLATRASVSSVHSSSEPVHQCTRSGWVSSGDLVDPGEDALVGRGGALPDVGLGRVGGHAHRFLSRIRVLARGPGTTDGHRRGRWCVVESICGVESAASLRATVSVPRRTSSKPDGSRCW